MPFIFSALLIIIQLDSYLKLGYSTSTIINVFLGVSLFVLLTSVISYLFSENGKSKQIKTEYWLLSVALQTLLTIGISIVIRIGVFESYILANILIILPLSIKRSLPQAIFLAMSDVKLSVVLALPILLYLTTPTLEINNSTVAFQFWPDGYILGLLIQTISNAQDISTIQQPLLAGETFGFYHMGAYIIGAILNDFGLDSGLITLTTLLTPISFAALSVALYTTSSLFFSDFRKKVTFLSIVWLLPDAYAFASGNNYTGFLFTIGISPSLAFGLAFTLMHLYYLVKFFENRSVENFTYTVIFSITLVFFKVHLAVFLAPISSFFFMLAIFKKQIYLRYVYASLIAFITVTLMTIASSHFSSIPVYFYSFTNPLWFVKLLSLTQYESYSEYILYQATHLPGNFRTLNSLGYITIICFALYPFFGAFSWKWADNSRKKFFGAFSYASLICFLINALFLSHDSRMIGAPDELIHRPFVVPYILLVFLTAVSIVKLFSERYIYYIVVLMLLINITVVNRESLYKIDNKTENFIDLCTLEAAVELREQKDLYDFKSLIVFPHINTTTISSLSGISAFWGGRDYRDPDLESISVKRKSSLEKVDVKSSQKMNSLFEEYEILSLVLYRLEEKIGKPECTQYIEIINPKTKSY